MGNRDVPEGGQVLFGVDQQRRHCREPGLERGGDLVDLVGDLGWGELGEDGADGDRDHLGGGLGHPGQGVAELVKP